MVFMTLTVWSMDSELMLLNDFNTYKLGTTALKFESHSPQKECKSRGDKYQFEPVSEQRPYIRVSCF